MGDIEKNIVYAPVLIPTLCRYEHFVRCIESLKRNGWARYTDVFIALDYPAQESHWDGYKKICTYLECEENFQVFSSFNVERRAENFGSLKNSQELVERVLERYDRYIRTDDDIEFSPNFLEYMDKCLAYYQDDENVIAVTGYSYPVNWKVSENSTAFKENFIVPTWGLGFWKNKRQVLVEYIVEQKVLIRRFDEIMQTKAYKRMTTACFVEYVNGCLNEIPEKHLIGRITDISLRMYCSIENRYVIMPVISKARNHGFDGSGVFCQLIPQEKPGMNSKDYSFARQIIDNSLDFTLVEDEKNAVTVNQQLLDAFDKRSFLKVLRAWCKYILYRTLGKKSFFAIRRWLKANIKR